jgi:uncharacterized protein DUF1566/PKD domain-containing protein
MSNSKSLAGWMIISMLFIFAGLADAQTFKVVDTGQKTCFDNNAEISNPSEGQDYYGQDAQHQGYEPSYTDNGDGTVTDNVTGLMWQQSFDHNGDGVVDYDDKLTYDQILALVADGVTFAGYSDWRLPTIKEQYSLILFSGRDISGYEGTDTDDMIPFIDNEVFEFAYGDTDAGERLIDMQCATTNVYLSTEVSETVFGVNFADGRIKGYGTQMMGQGKAFNYQLVRDNKAYGQNDFADNGDGTISDKATGLMWKQEDNGEGVIWKDALEIAEESEFGGYSDWRLPNAKELQSIVDYERSPSRTNSAAIEPLFSCTQITNEAGNADYPWYWSSTTHGNMMAGHEGGWGAYLSFGRCMGNMQMPGQSTKSWIDIHGAGSQRSDPKDGDPDEFEEGHGPQGDAIRIYNYVRLVRDIDDNTGENSAPATPAIPSGTEDGEINANYTYSTSTTDVDGDDVYYMLDWGNGNLSEWFGPYASGEEIEAEYTWLEEGNYNVRAKAKDTENAESAWSEALVVSITDGNTGENSAPATPAIPSGREDGKINENYTYSTSTTDVDGDDVYYMLDWGNGDLSEWFGPYASGEEIEADYSWVEPGTYNVRAKAKDTEDAESSWSEALVVDITDGNDENIYNIVETGQVKCYDTDGKEITPPGVDNDLFGQDAQFESNKFSFIDNGDGTVSDVNTGLMWQQVPSSSDYNWQQAVDYCDDLDFAGYDDWRIPSLKELFSISDFNSGWPYLDTELFTLASGQVSKDEQYWTSNYYVGTTVEGGSNSAFGVNHVTGHIKAYSAKAGGPVGGKYVRAVRGGSYGVNAFKDNSDGTISDQASGLMWLKNDSEEGMDWENALIYAKDMIFAGYSDWRLPNVKELQSIVDYSRSPSATDEAHMGPAIDPMFNCTPITNEADVSDYAYYWTNTSANFTGGEPYYYAWYVAFGRAVNGEGKDFHGAGAVRFDTKVEGGPLGEGGERYYNYVRLVREIDGSTAVDGTENSSNNLVQLDQNHPNPFDETTTISFTLNEPNHAVLRIYNSFGIQIATLVNSQLSQGDYSYQWQPVDQLSGIFHYSLVIGGQTTVAKKMIYLK